MCKHSGGSERCGESEHAGSVPVWDHSNPVAQLRGSFVSFSELLLREEKRGSRAAFIEGGPRAEKSETHALSKSIPSQ